MTQSHQKKNNDEKSYSRGGRDRSFLELIQILGNEFGIKNKIIFVDNAPLKKINIALFKHSI